MSLLTKIDFSNNALLLVIYGFALDNNIISTISDKYSRSDVEFIKDFQSIVRIKFKIETDCL